MPKFKGESVQRLAPIVDRHRPFFGDALQGQVIELEQRFLVGKDATVLADLAQRPVQRLDGVGRVKWLCEFPPGISRT